jgi:ABC-type glutathione transport system ATPase component
MSLLEVGDLAISFPGVHAVKGISFDVPARGSVAVVGESGSGKSVTALSIMGLLPESAKVSGRILYRGRNLVRPGRRAGCAARRSR